MIINRYLTLVVPHHSVGNAKFNFDKKTQIKRIKIFLYNFVINE